ncbi:MAG: LysM peptidoglycan-binding domain-containing protein [Shimia sp.]
MSDYTLGEVIASALLATTGAFGSSLMLVDERPLMQAPGMAALPMAPRTAPATVPEPPLRTAEDPIVTEDAPAPAIPPAPEPATAELPTGTPTFDVVRIDPDGAGIIAGAATPGAAVTVLLDGAPLVEAEADRAGKFVGFIDLPTSQEARILSLTAMVGGASLESDQTVIIEGAPAPSVQTADAQPTMSEPLAGSAPGEDGAAPSTLGNDVQTVQTTEAPTPAPPVTEQIAALPPQDAGPRAERGEVQEARPAATAETAGDPLAGTGPTSSVVEDEVTTVADSTSPAAEAEAPAQPLVETRPDADTALADGVQTAADTDSVARSASPPALEPATSDDTQGPERSATAGAVEQQDVQQTTSASVTPAAPIQDEAQPAPPGPAPTIVADAPIAPSAPGVSAGAPTSAAESPVARAPRVLMASSEGLRVLQAPQTMTSVALDTITYDPEGAVALGGRGTSEGFIRVYIDDRPISTAPIQADGSWEADLPNVDTGVYTLRVDQLTPEGAVESRVETPFQREAPEAIQALQDDNLTTGPVQEALLTVQPGATLWAIASARYGEGNAYVKVFEANRDRIRDPDLIYPGQVFDLPD